MSRESGERGKEREIVRRLGDDAETGDMFTDPPAVAEDPSSRVLQLLVQLTIDDKVMDVLFSARQLQLLSCRQTDKKLL